MLPCTGIHKDYFVLRMGIEIKIGRISRATKVIRLQQIEAQNHWHIRCVGDAAENTHV